jgi:hypothetical protein
MAAPDQVFGDAYDGVRDAVDVRRERLCNDRDSHAPTVRVGAVHQETLV